MTAINVNALQIIILAVVDLLTIGLIAWGVWEILFNRNVGGFLTRAVSAIALFSIFNAVVPAMLGTAPSIGGDATSARAIYDNSVGLILNKVPGMIGADTSGTGTGTLPGEALVKKGVDISTAIWAGIINTKIIFLPIAWCLITWAIEIARGAGWIAVGGKALFLTLLLSIVAGPVNRGLPAEVIKISSAVVSGVCNAIVNPADKGGEKPKDEQGKPQEWTRPLVALSNNNAKPPTGLTSLASPYIGSCERSLTGETLKQLQKANFIGQAADGLVANLWYVSPSPDADPKDFLNLATPIENKYDVLFTEVEADEFIRRHYMDADNTVFDAAKSKVGYIKIGASANPSELIAQEYERQRQAFIQKLEKANADLDSTNGNPDIIAANRMRIKAAQNYKPPTALPVSTIPVLAKVRSFIDNYTEMTLRYKQDVLPRFEALDPDAWTILWMTTAGRAELGKIRETPATPGTTGAPVPTPGPEAGKQIFNTSDYYREWAGNENIFNSMARNEQSATTQEPAGSFFNIWQTIKSLIYMFFVALAEGGMALAMLALKLLVLLLAPLVLYAGLFAVSVGMFIVCCAYPIAAFMSLFPGRWAILLDWTKGVLWCMTWIPIMLVGISLCEFNADQITSNLNAVLGSIPGLGAVKSTVTGAAAAGSASASMFPGFPSQYMSPGLITTELVSTIVGIFMICASPMVANLVFNPGIAGISSLTTSMISQVTGTVAGLAAVPLLAAGAGVAAGAKGALAGASKLTQADQAKKLAAAGGDIQRNTPAGSGVSAGAGLQSISKALGGAGAEGISKAASAFSSIPGASRLATGVVAGAQAMGGALESQMKRQLQGLKSMVSPEGITPTAARFSQAAAAAVRGDLLGAQSLAKGHGEHTSDSDFAGRSGGRGGSGGDRGDQGTKPGAGTIAPAPGAKPEIAAALAAKKEPHERALGAKAAETMLAGGRSPDGLTGASAARDDSLRYGAESLAAAKNGNVSGAAYSAGEAMKAALSSGDAGLAGHAASRFLKAHESEVEQAKGTGKVIPSRAQEMGMADYAMSAQRSEVQSQASARGVSVPETTNISPVNSDEDKLKHESIAAHHIANYDSSDPQTWGSSGKALVAAMRSGDPGLISQARALVGETAQQACQMDAGNPYKEGALRDAGVGLAVAGPTDDAPSMPMMDLPADSGGAGSQQYQTMMASAQSGERILASQRQRPDPGLMRSTLGVARLALASARNDNNPAHIAEAGALVHRTASMAAKLPPSHPDTPSIQMDAADSLMDASVGCEQASQIHESYTADLMRSAGEAPPGSTEQKQLTDQSEVHFQRHVQLRGKSSALQFDATKMAREAVSSARVGAAIGGSQRMGTLNQVYNRAEPILSPRGDQRPAELDDHTVRVAPVESAPQEAAGSGAQSFFGKTRPPQAEG